MVLPLVEQCLVERSHTVWRRYRMFFLVSLNFLAPKGFAAVSTNEETAGYE
jgi:hypothetical protein